MSHSGGGRAGIGPNNDMGSKLPHLVGGIGTLVINCDSFPERFRVLDNGDIIVKSVMLQTAAAAIDVKMVTDTQLHCRVDVARLCSFVAMTT